VSKLAVQEVEVRFGGVAALVSASLSVQEGSIHGVIGPNGAGKTTLIDVISGRRRPTRGKVVLDGVDVTSRTVVWRRRNGMARTFQRTSVFPMFTVREQFEMVARGVGTADDPDEISEILLGLGLRDLADDLCGELSYGQQRVVDCGLALIGHPRVVLLDEPGAGLSSAESALLLDHVAGLCQRNGVAAILVEHDVDAVFRVCDAVTVLHLGSVIANGDPATVRKNPDVVHAYLGAEG
jgi:branched-chain amino acid transport system ATP-binding protein